MPGGTSGVGVLFRATDESDLVGLALAAEARGFDALVLGEHTHIPVDSDESSFPGGDDGIPQSYARLLDPYVALSWVAATTSLKIGTSTSLPAEHDPIALAKAVATLDHLSGGRLTFGVGYGWNREELANHGHEFKHRRAIVREHVELMRALWTDVEAEYHGDHVDLPPSWMWPKPAHHIPVLLGVAAGDLAMDAIVQWGDGWMPGGPPEWIAGRLTELRRRWADAGRSARGPTIWVLQEFEVDDDTARRKLDALFAAEVDEVLISFHSTDPEEVLPVLDRYAPMIAANVA